jgi:hypothetical protein
MVFVRDNVMNTATDIIQMLCINEATDLSSIPRSAANAIIIDKPISKLEKIRAKDDLVIAVHGTYEYWALWFCVYGLDTTVEPPTKTLGRGNMASGFSKIKSNGLFVAADKTSGFMTHVYFEVKPSELGISLEMAELGYKEGQELYTLIIGDCLIAKPLPAKRVNKVRHNNKEYTRQEFIKLFPDPKGFLRTNASNKMYSDTPLKNKMMLNNIYQHYKKRFKRGDSVEKIKASVEDALKHGDYETWGFSKKDLLKLLAWVESKEI